MPKVDRLTISQAATRSGMLEQTLRKLCKRGDLKGARLESLPGQIPYWTIPTATIDSWRPRPKGWPAGPRKKPKKAAKEKRDAAPR